MALTAKLLLENSRFLSNDDIHLLLRSNKASWARSKADGITMSEEGLTDTSAPPSPSLKSKICLPTEKKFSMSLAGFMGLSVFSQADPEHQGERRLRCPLGLTFTGMSDTGPARTVRGVAGLGRHGRV